jgi:hypothetical protein
MPRKEEEIPGELCCQLLAARRGEGRFRTQINVVFCRVLEKAMRLRTLNVHALFVNSNANELPTSSTL